MISGVHVKVLLALLYAMFLMGVAFVLECLARRSQKGQTVTGTQALSTFMVLTIGSVPQVNGWCSRRLISAGLPFIARRRMPATLVR